MARYPLPTAITADVTTGHDLDSQEANKRYNFEGPKVSDFLAVGDANHNTGGGTHDRQAFQDAINAAHSNNVGQVIVDKGSVGSTFRIGDPLDGTPLKMHTAAGTGGSIRLIGLPRRQGDGQHGPTLVWDGPTDGTPRAMLDYDTVSANVGASPAEDVRLNGKWIQNASAIRYRKKADLGTYLRNVWFARWHGDSILYDVGSTNAYIYHCRWDSCTGYAVRMTFTTGVIFGMYDCTYVCDDLLGGTDPIGFFYAERSGGDVNLCGFFNFENINLEVQTHLREVEAGGTDPSDRRGLFHLLTNSAHTTQQQTITFNHIKVDTASAKNSYSLFLARGDGTVNQRGRRLIIIGKNVRGMNGNGTAATGHRIMLGNVAAGQKSSTVGDNFAVFEHKPQNTEIAANQRAITHIYTGTD
jgi:hypothetical protein